MKHLILSLFVALTLTAAPVMAQAETSKSTPEKEALLKELFEVTEIKKTMVTMTGDLIRLEMLKRLRSNPKANPELIKWVGDFIIAEFENQSDQLLADIGQIYLDNFTEEDLRVMVAYQKTETGKKASRLLPTISQQSMVIGQRWGQRIGIEAIMKIREKLKKDGIDI